MDKLSLLLNNLDTISFSVGALLGVFFPKKTVAGKIGRLLTGQKQ